MTTGPARTPSASVRRFEQQLSAIEYGLAWMKAPLARVKDTGQGHEVLEALGSYSSRLVYCSRIRRHRRLG